MTRDAILEILKRHGLYYREYMNSIYLPAALINIGFIKMVNEDDYWFDSGIGARLVNIKPEDVERFCIFMVLIQGNIHGLFE